MDGKTTGKKDVSLYLKVISDKNRLAILELLKKGEIMGRACIEF